MKKLLNILFLLLTVAATAQDRIDWDQIKAAFAANYIPLSDGSGNGVWTTRGAVLSGANSVYGTGSTGYIAEWLNDSTLTFDATGAYLLSVGTDAQRPTGATGLIRYNSTNGNFEYYGAAAWEFPVKSSTSNGLFTAGSVLFADANGRAAQNTTSNKQFHWDDTNTRLGIGIASPSYPVHIYAPSSASVANVVNIETDRSSGGAAGAAGIRLENSSGQRAQMLLTSTGTASANSTRFETQTYGFRIYTSVDVSLYTTNTGYFDVFFASTANSRNRKLVLSNIGRMGIGADRGATTDTMTIAAYALDVRGNNAIAFPRGTTATRPTYVSGYSPTRFNTDSTAFEGHDGTDWRAWATRAWARSTFAPIASGYTGWTLAGTSGTPQSIASGQTATIAAGAGLTTTAGATRTVTVAADTATTLVSKAFLTARGYVDGSGSADRSARWTDANTITTGAFRDDGTNIGLGDVIVSTTALNVLKTATGIGSFSDGITATATEATSDSINYVSGISAYGTSSATGIVNSVWGGYFQASGTGDVANKYGVQGIANHTGGTTDNLTAVYGLANIGASGTGDVYGTYSLINAYTDGGATNAYGMYSSILWANNNNFTNAYGLYVRIRGVTDGQVTNGYGVYLAALDDGGGDVTNKWGVYQAGASDVNYFAGNVGITDASPDYTLDMDGSTGAVAFPVGTTAQRPTNQAGLLRWNTDTPGLEVGDGSAWNGVIDGSGAATRIAYFSDGNTLTSDASLTYDGAGTILIDDGSYAAEISNIYLNLSDAGGLYDFYADFYQVSGNWNDSGGSDMSKGSHNLSGAIGSNQLNGASSSRYNKAGTDAPLIFGIVGASDDGANSVGGELALRSSRTTSATTHGVTQSGDLLGRVTAWGNYDQTGATLGWSGKAFTSKIEFRATELFSSTARGSKIVFSTTDNTTTTVDDRVVIDQNGDLYALAYDDTKRDSAAHLMGIQESTGKLVPIAQVNAKYFEDTDLTLTAAEIYKFQEVRVWMSTTVGAASQTELTIPDAAAVYTNTKIIITSSDANGTYNNIVNTPGSTIYEAGSDASSIVVAAGETIVLWGIRTGASTYRWAVQKN